MVPQSELNILKQFDTEGHLALSLYLDLSTPKRRAGALERVLSALSASFPSGTGGNGSNGSDGHDPEELGGLQEDLELVRLYFRASGSCRSAYMAIFSCAPQLFWRVYHFDEPLQELLEIGHCLNVAPLEVILSGRAADPARGERSRLAAPLRIC